MDESSLAGDDNRGERRPGFRAAGASVSRIVRPIAARHGDGVLVRIKSQWSEIVGPELADSTWPEALARDGALKLRVTSAKALEVQHRAPLVIERINLFFGRDAVTRLALVQGPLPLATPPKQSPAPTLDAPAAAALDRRLETVANAELRAALARLGRRVLAAGE